MAVTAGQQIEALVFNATADRHNARLAGRTIDAAAGSIRIVALMNCLLIVDPERWKDVAEMLKKL